MQNCKECGRNRAHPGYANREPFGAFQGQLDEIARVLVTCCLDPLSVGPTTEMDARNGFRRKLLALVRGDPNWRSILESRQHTIPRLPLSRTPCLHGGRR